MRGLYKGSITKGGALTDYEKGGTKRLVYGFFWGPSADLASVMKWTLMRLAHYFCQDYYLWFFSGAPVGFFEGFEKMDTNGQENINYPLNYKFALQPRTSKLS